MRIGAALHSLTAILRSRLRAWMQIAMATRYRPRDVAPMPADVSKSVMDVSWCNRASESCYSTACAELCTLQRGSLTQSNSTSTFKRPSVHGQAQLPSEDEEACPRIPREYKRGKSSRHVENSLLSGIRSSKGARESSGDGGNKRHIIQLDSFDDLLTFYHVYCLFLT